mmetsp:Transcript_164943/g.400939  ORF Transcript_164943/g.400939 Transcript_164943/m.400939 type:complete len:200 (-) Transcript_164943:672-1271(-)
MLPRWRSSPVSPGPRRSCRTLWPGTRAFGHGLQRWLRWTLRRSRPLRRHGRRHGRHGRRGPGGLRGRLPGDPAHLQPRGRRRLRHGGAAHPRADHDELQPAPAAGVWPRALQAMRGVHGDVAWPPARLLRREQWHAHQRPRQQPSPQARRCHRGAAACHAQRADQIELALRCSCPRGSVRPGRLQAKDQRDCAELQAPG